jgi:hypothetical protein
LDNLACGFLQTLYKQETFCHLPVS